MWGLLILSNFPMFPGTVEPEGEEMFKVNGNPKDGSQEVYLSEWVRLGQSFLVCPLLDFKYQYQV